MTATMESLIGLVNRIQRACTALGDYGGGDTAFSSLWDALPSVAVVGGQVYLFLLPFSFSCCKQIPTHMFVDRCTRERAYYFGSNWAGSKPLSCYYGGNESLFGSGCFGEKDERNRWCFFMNTQFLVLPQLLERKETGLYSQFSCCLNWPRKHLRPSLF